MTDSQLIRSYLDEGSEAAFSELVGRYVNLVHSAALRQVGGDFHRAKDVTQMVFTLLARKAESLTGHTALSGWLHKTTHYSAKNLMRPEVRRQRREERANTMNELLANPESQIDWDQLRPVLDGVMLELNERDRQAVLGRFFDDQPLAVIGEKLGVSENAAGLRVNRALEKMRRLLTRRGVSSSTAALAMMLETHAVVAAPAGLAETAIRAAMSSVAGAGLKSSGFLRLLGKAKLAVSTPSVLWIGGLMLTSAIGGAAYGLWEARQAAAPPAAEDKFHSSEQEHLAALQRSLSAGDQDSIKLLAAIAKLSPRPVAVARDTKADTRKFLAVYPQAKPMVIDFLKAYTLRLYDSFFRSAKLTPSQIEQFETAVAESSISTLIISQETFSSVGIAKPPENQMRAILGDQDYEQYLTYSQTAYAHFWAHFVAGFSAETPFSADQEDQLARIIANNNTLPQMDFPTQDSIGESAKKAIDWDAVIPQARAILSDAQWKVTEPMLVNMRATSALAKASQSAKQNVP